MATFATEFDIATGTNTVRTVRAFVDRGDFLVTIWEAGSQTKTEFKKGSTVIDPITDEDVTLIYGSTNGFWVEDRSRRRYLLDLQETFAANI